MFWYIDNIPLETILSSIQSLKKVESCIIANGGKNTLIKKKFKKSKSCILHLFQRVSHKTLIDLKPFICSGLITAFFVQKQQRHNLMALNYCSGGCWIKNTWIIMLFCKSQQNFTMWTLHSTFLFIYSSLYLLSDSWFSMAIFFSCCAFKAPINSIVHSI